MPSLASTRSPPLRPESAVILSYKLSFEVYMVTGLSAVMYVVSNFVCAALSILAAALQVPGSPLTHASLPIPVIHLLPLPREPLARVASPILVAA